MKTDQSECRIQLNIEPIGVRLTLGINSSGRFEFSNGRVTFKNKLNVTLVKALNHCLGPIPLSIA